MEKIYVAKLGKAIGLKGQQKLHIDSDFPEQFKKGAVFYTDKNQKLTIESYNKKNDSVKFEGIDDIDQAKKLTNRQLFVSKEDTRDMCKLDKKQFFWFDIIGCKIIEDDTTLGVVEDVQRMPLSDYLQIVTTSKLIEEKKANSFLLPYTDDFINDVDIENKTIKATGAIDILEAS